jgi:hypothetical protein
VDEAPPADNEPTDEVEEKTEEGRRRKALRRLGSWSMTSEQHHTAFFPSLSHSLDLIFIFMFSAAKAEESLHRPVAATSAEEEWVGWWFELVWV